MTEWLSQQFPLIPAWEVALRLVLAALLGLPLGLEREARDKPAGLKTFAMVSLGAAGFVLGLVQGLAVVPVPADAVEYDPTGVVAAIAGGIGFLGAGAIFTAGGTVRGLTTGASIWLAGAIGLAAALGQIVLAVFLSGFGLVVLTVFGRFENAAFEEAGTDARDDRPPPDRR